MNDNGTDIFEGTLDALDGIAEGTGLNVKKAGELVDEEDANPTNEQELDEILAKTIYDTGAKLTEIGWERWGDNLEEAKQAIKQLTNAEIARTLDNLLEGKFIGEYGDEMMYAAEIQAERAKLKEVK